MISLSLKSIKKSKEDPNDLTSVKLTYKKGGLKQALVSLHFSYVPLAYLEEKKLDIELTVTFN